MPEDPRDDHPHSASVVLASRYRLERRIGRGGMADVYRATDEVLHRPVAVKVFRGDAPDEATIGGRSRIEAEVRLLASLRHPGLVTVYDAGISPAPEPDGARTRPMDLLPATGEEDGTPYLVMELIEGPTLAGKVSGGPMQPVEVARLGAELAAALAYVHSRGVVHRDIKPANILIEEADTPTPGMVKLTDFGIARLVDSTRVTEYGMTVGTANYLSPEQARTGESGPAGDVYSLGLVLLECLTGQRAFPGVGIDAALARLQRSPEVPTTFGQGWAALVTAMTQRDPARRPVAAQVAAALADPAAVRAPDLPDESSAGAEATVAIPALAAGAMPVAAAEAESAATSVLVGLEDRGAGDTALLARPGAGKRQTTRRRPGWLVPVAAVAVLVLGAVLAVVLSSGSGRTGGAAPSPSTSAVTGVATTASAVSSVTTVASTASAPTTATPASAPAGSQKGNGPGGNGPGGGPGNGPPGKSKHPGKK